MNDLLDTTVPAGAVVVGYTRSAAADDALDWATEQAVLRGRPLVLAHATGSLGTAGTTWLEHADPDTSHPIQEMLGTARTVLDEARARVAARHPDLEVVPMVRLDDVVPALLSLAPDAGSLVVGSHAPTFTGHHVGPRLAGRSPVPVVVVPHQHPGVVRRGVLAGVAADLDAEGVLDHAFDEASRRGLPLTVVHTTSDGSGASDEEHRLWLAEACAGQEERHPDVHVTRHIDPGRPTPRLLDLAAQMHLLVIGRHRHTGLLDIPVGHVRRSFTARSACPVVVVPPRITQPS